MKTLRAAALVLGSVFIFTVPASGQKAPASAPTADPGSRVATGASVQPMGAQVQVHAKAPAPRTHDLTRSKGPAPCAGWEQSAGASKTLCPESPWGVRVDSRDRSAWSPGSTPARPE